MAITISDIKTIKRDLAKLRPAGLTPAIDRGLSLKESIVKLAPVLCRMKKRGFTTAEVAEALKKHDLHIKGATLNRYLQEHRAKDVDADRPLKKRAKKKRTDEDASGACLPDSQDEAVAHDLIDPS